MTKASSWHFDEALTAAETFAAAWTHGIRYFDTASYDGLDLSERRLGALLRGQPRDSYILSTKVGRLLVANPVFAGEQHPEGFARAGPDLQVGLSIEQALDQLPATRVMAAIHQFSINGCRGSHDHASTGCGLSSPDPMPAW